MQKANLPLLYLELRQAAEALAHAEKRRSLRASFDETLAREVRSLVELEAQTRDEKIGIMALARLDVEAELARIVGPQDRIDTTDSPADDVWKEVAVRREAICSVYADANRLSETKETVEFAQRIFDGALAAWEASLRSSDAGPSRDLLRIDREQGSLAAHVAELDEAIDAATKAGVALDAADQSVRRAIASIDRVRGLGSRLLVHSPWLPDVIDELHEEASASLTSAQRWLTVLDAELNDLSESDTLTVEPPEPVQLVIRAILGIGTAYQLDGRVVRHGLLSVSLRLREMRSDLAALDTELHGHRAAHEQKREALDLERLQLLLERPSRPS